MRSAFARAHGCRRTALPIAAAVALSFGAAGAARAQLSANPRDNPPAPARPPATAQQNPGAPPEVIAPSGRGTGVLHPPGNVDPGMKVTPPPSKEFPMPVIPPPGTKGSSRPNAVPK